MPGEFQRYEIVKLKPSAPAPNLKTYRGQEGHILGIYDGEDGSISYDVVFYPAKEDWERLIDEDWGMEIAHEHLITTGKIGKREDHYPGNSIRVRPDGSVVQGDE